MKSNELLNIQNGKETPEEKFNAIYKPIDKTPFTMIAIEKNKHFIAMGKHRLTEYHETENQALDEIENNFWQTIMNVIHITLENFELILQIKKDTIAKNEVLTAVHPQEKNEL